MARARQYTWFVEPRNAFTNEVISRELPEENYFSCIQCDGSERNLWGCDYPYIRNLIASKVSFPLLDFNVFNREGSGRIRQWRFVDAEYERVKRLLAGREIRSPQ